MSERVCWRKASAAPSCRWLEQLVCSLFHLALSRARPAGGIMGHSTCPEGELEPRAVLPPSRGSLISGVSGGLSSGLGQATTCPCSWSLLPALLPSSF